MVVMILEKVPSRLRGYLSRWLIEINTGVYVGKVSAVVRDLLWERSINLAGDGRLSQVWQLNNEQGFTFRFHGDHNRKLIDCDGMSLVAIKTTQTKPSNT